MGAIAAQLGLGAGAYFSILFFILFFCGFAVYYWSMAYVVDEHGVTYRGATDFVYVPWEDIREVKSSDLPLGGWIVNARGGGIVLSKFVRQRAELVDLIIARAGLFPTA